MVRPKGRGTPDHPSSSTKSPEYVLQLGSAKIPVHTEGILRAANREGRHADEDQLTSVGSDAGSEADKAVDALLRMREAFSTTSTSSGDDWRPWSPDDLYPPPRDFQAHYFHGSPNGTITQGQLPLSDPRREYHEYQAQSSVDTPISTPVNTPAWRTPTIFDGLEDQARRVTSNPMQATQLDEPKRSKKLDLTQLFPQPGQTKTRMLSSAKHSRPLSGVLNSGDSGKSGRSASRRNRSGTNQSQSSNGGSTNKPSSPGYEMVKNSKTHIRRPPKGIQNWFDGFISSDEDEVEEEEEEDNVMEPQELPADDIPPPAYSAPVRQLSRASLKSPSELESAIPHDRQLHVQVHEAEAELPARSKAESDTASTFADSLASSQQPGQTQGSYGKIAESKFASDSVLSLSGSESSSTAGSDSRGYGTIRTIPDNNTHPWGVTYGSASTVDLHRLPVSTTEDASRKGSKKRSSSVPRDGATTIRSSTMSHDRFSADRFLRAPVRESRSMTSLNPTQVALRRLNGMSMMSGMTVDTTTTFERDSSCELAADPKSSAPSDASHVMAVTKEEMMLLELIRRKHAAMQQISFTEGYQLALRKGERPPNTRSASAEQAALKILKRGAHRSRHNRNSTSPEDSYYENVRKKLSAIQKEDVDEALKMKRFLEMDSPSQVLSPTEEKDMSPGLASSAPQSDVVLYNRHSFATTTDHTEKQDGFDSDSDADTYSHAARSKNVAGASQRSSAFSTSSSTKKSKRVSYRKSTNAAAPPSPVMEEEAAPEVPARNPKRASRTSGSHAKSGRRSSRNVESREAKSDRTSKRSRSTSRQRASRHADANHSDAASATHPTSSSANTQSPLSSLITAAASQGRPTSSRAGRQSGTDTENYASASSQNLKKKSSSAKRPSPRSIKTASTIDQLPSPTSRTTRVRRSNTAGEDVLAAWAELGGGSEVFRRGG